VKIMVLTPYLPHRRVGHGGGTAVRDLVTWLGRKHEVMVLSLVRPGEERLLPEVEELGVTVRGLPFLDHGSRGWDRLSLVGKRLSALVRALVSGYPPFVEKYADRRISELIRRAVHDFQPDAIQIEYLQMSLYCRDLRHDRERTGNSRPRLVLNSHELGHVPRERRATRTTNPLVRASARVEAAAWRRLELAASKWADVTLCVTPEDHELYRMLGADNLVTVPLGMDLKALAVDWQPTAADGRETYLFVGSFGHRPNRLAAEFLLDRLWPRVKAARPQAVLILAGRGSDTFLASHLEPGQWLEHRIEAPGFVDDLTPLFRDCRLFVAPLPEGGGIKIKILEAMARGAPVVTTPVGAEGIASAADDTLIISPCDDSFADAWLDAADDLTECRRRARRARQVMEDRFSWDAITDRLVHLYAANGPQRKISDGPAGASESLR